MKTILRKYSEKQLIHNRLKKNDLVTNITRKKTDVHLK